MMVHLQKKGVLQHYLMYTLSLSPIHLKYKNGSLFKVKDKEDNPHHIHS